MSRYPLFLCALWLLMVATVCAQETPEPRFAPRQGMLLLRNGQAISGKIGRTGDRYIVWVADGEIRLTADQVDLVCQDLQDGYRLKHDQIVEGNTTAHLDLAEWCLRHKLHAKALREIEATRAIEPDHPLLPLIQRRYQLSVAAPEPASKSNATPAVALPRVVSDEDLEQMVSKLPAGTVETFHQKIQPLLLNSCTAVGCHSIHGRNSFRLSRGAARLQPSRRTTLRNLQAVLEYVDRSDPEADSGKKTTASLLTTISVPHGRAKEAVFEKSSWQYEQLSNWINSLRQPATRPAQQPDRPLVIKLDNTVVPAGAQAHPEPGAAEPATGEQRAVEWTIRPRPSVPKPGQLPQAETPAGQILRQFPNIHTRPHRSEPNRGDVQQPNFQAADPFDPAIFNRRFFPSPR